jgi:cardiolipin synthase
MRALATSLAARWLTHRHGFRPELGVLLGPPFIDGTRHQVLVNGDQIFPAMLAAIRPARASITFETYIYRSGAIGAEFAAALAERARHGVKVHLLLDWVGSAKMDESLRQEMTVAGVQIRRFHPPHWSHLARLDNRTHRKLLVVDGKLAFTGGVGIAPQWTGHAQDPIIGATPTSRSKDRSWPKSAALWCRECFRRRLGSRWS